MARQCYATGPGAYVYQVSLCVGAVVALQTFLGWKKKRGKSADLGGARDQEKNMGDIAEAKLGGVERAKFQISPQRRKEMLTMAAPSVKKLGTPGG